MHRVGQRALPHRAAPTPLALHAQTHKTGSTTLAAIMFRAAVNANMSQYSTRAHYISASEDAKVGSWAPRELPALPWARSSGVYAGPPPHSAHVSHGAALRSLILSSHNPLRTCMGGLDGHPVRHARRRTVRLPAKRSQSQSLYKHVTLAGMVCPLNHPLLRPPVCCAPLILACPCAPHSRIR